MSRFLILFAIIALAGITGIFLQHRPIENPLTETPSSYADSVEESQASGAFEPELQREAHVPTDDWKPIQGVPVKGGLEVQVISEVSGKPIPFASVLVVTQADLKRQTEGIVWQPFWGEEYAFLRFGTRYPTDENGRTHIPRSKEPRLRIAARTETAFGLAVIPSDTEGPFQMTIGDVIPLQAHVTDSQGGNLSQALVELKSTDTHPSQFHIVAQSDMDGMASMRLRSDFMSTNSQREALLEVKALTRVPVAAPIDLASPPVETVELQLPACGSVKVTVMGVSGKPYNLGHRLELAIVEDKAFETPPMYAPVGAPRAVEASTAATTVFYNVEVGTQLWISATNLQNSRKAVALFQGPSTQGAVAEVVLTLKPVKAILVGQVLDADGQIAAGVTLSAKVVERRANGSGSRTTQLKCDPEGHFRFVLDKPLFEPDTTRSFVLRMLADSSSRDLRMNEKEEFSRGEIRVDLSFDVPIGVTDLGALQLTPIPILAAGQVVRWDGSGVANASLKVEKQYVDDQGNLRPDFWIPLLEVDFSVDAAGGFRALGAIPKAGNYRIAVTAPNQTKAFQIFEVGEENLRIEMAGAQTITGHILLDEDISIDQISIDYIPYAQGTKAFVVGPGEGSKIQADGSFTFLNVPAGGVDIVVKCRQSQQLLAEPLTLMIDGASGPDPITIDLRGLLTQMVLHVEESNGNPIEEYSIRIPDFSVTRVGGGQAERRILSPKLGQRLEVSAAGKRTVSLPITNSEQTVVLPEGLAVRLHISNMELVPEGFFLSGELLREGIEGWEHGWPVGERFSLADGVGDCIAPDSGHYRISLNLIRDEAGLNDDKWALFRGRSIGRLSEQPLKIQIEDTDRLQEFTIAINEADFEKTLENYPER